MVMISGESGTGFDQLIERAALLSKTSATSHIYVCGAANVGKSTLVNKLLNKGYRMFS